MDKVSEEVLWEMLKNGDITVDSYDKMMHDLRKEKEV